jgi:hypothetical protein
MQVFYAFDELSLYAETISCRPVVIVDQLSVDETPVDKMSPHRKNTLAYLNRASTTNKKRFLGLTPGGRSLGSPTAASRRQEILQTERRRVD